MSSNCRSNYPNLIHSYVEEGKIHFTFVSRQKECGVAIFDRKTGEEIQRLAFCEKEASGFVHHLELTSYDPSEISYLFYEQDELVPDPYACKYTGCNEYGKKRGDSDLKALFVEDEYDWEEDSRPKLNYNDVIVYCMHVRGFTAHQSSGVKHRGTFWGIEEKIPYLKEIGITTIELQPAYEFNENMESSKPSVERRESKLNYWGYKSGFYCAPKAAYCATASPEKEFKDLVKELHRNGMEIIMQFYFPREINRMDIPGILEFWANEYHVDGFRVMGENLDIDFVTSNPYIADRKLWIGDFSREHPYQDHLAVYNDRYADTMRRFLKGDDNQLEAALYQMRSIPKEIGRIHYLTNYYGFTLADLVSYNYKHNEANGEMNRDGNDYNLSWNCGEEGDTRSLKIKKLRKQQIKNGIALLLLTQSTPLIFMGDEFGNSQKGNNNPYCQDNNITWLDWRCIQKNRDIFDFWKSMMEFRKNHSLIHPALENKVMDTLSCGMPDLSYHGESAWKYDVSPGVRSAGILLCGKYSTDDHREDIYIGINMHWEVRQLALPKIARNMRWDPVLSTGNLQGEVTNNVIDIPGRCIVVLKSTVEAREMRI